jgi:hypothetical protein
MTLADVQQQRLLERLREAGDQPVAFAELHAGGIAFPAAVVSELENPVRALALIVTSE